MSFGVTPETHIADSRLQAGSPSQWLTNGTCSASDRRVASGQGDRAPQLLSSLEAAPTAQPFVWARPGCIGADAGPEDGGAPVADLNQPGMTVRGVSHTQASRFGVATVMLSVSVRGEPPPLARLPTVGDRRHPAQSRPIV